MEQATISQLKDRLSAYLRKVRAGRTILIVDRDEPIARLERVEAADAPDAGGRLARLERAGLLRRGRARLDVAALERPVARSEGGSVVAALLDDRREGR